MIIRTFNFVTWRKFRNLVKKGAEYDYYCDTCDTWQSFYEMGESLKGEQPVRYRTNQDRHEMIIILRRPDDVLELD